MSTAIATQQVDFGKESDNYLTYLSKLRAATCLKPFASSPFHLPSPLPSISLTQPIHRPGFPSVFYDRLATIVDVKEKRVLDIGTGPGVIALELAKRGATV
jgi:2-polyprenyl-3-methyl-5-hydroxy-6-metoxy-1,4-benzoquinol methylase